MAARSHPVGMKRGRAALTICTRIGYTPSIAIRSFSGRALERLHSRDDARGVDPAHGRRLCAILDLLDGPDPLRALSAPAFRLHRLHGPRAGQWAVKVSHGWHVKFRVDGVDVRAVGYESYHH